MSRRILSDAFGSATHARRRSVRKPRLTLEALELRTMLTALSVDIGDAACTAAGPVYCEIQQAVDAAAAGDTIQVASGTYGPVEIYQSNITIEEAMPDSDPIIDAYGNDRSVWSQADGLTLKGMTLQNASGYTLALGGDNQTLIGNTMDGGQLGVYLTGDNNTLEGNLATGNRLGGYVFDFGTENNMIRENTATNTNWGFFVCGTGNTLVRNESFENQIGFSVDCYQDFASSGHLFQGNRAENNQQFGFLIEGQSHDITLRENFAVDGANDGFVVTAETTGSVLSGNTATGNGGVGFSSVASAPDSNTFEFNECRNNTVGDNQTGSLCLTIDDGHLVGDVNGDKRFSSSDLILVFAAGKYELGEPATFVEGDWDDNGYFDSSDLILASSEGHFVAEARIASSDLAAAADFAFAQRGAKRA